jgi:probable HAF family extracellular repeat protein
MFARLLCTIVLLLEMASVNAAPAFSISFLPPNSAAYSINQSGQFAGEALFPGDLRHAALWNTPTTPRDLGAFGDLSSAESVSNNGQVTGTSSLPGGAVHGFLYSGGALVDIGVLPGGSNSAGHGVNAAGTVVGDADDAAGESQPVIYANGALSALSPASFVYGQARGINDAGLVAGFGQFTGSDYAHAFLHGAGTLNDLGTLGGPASYAYAINDLGQVAGTSFIDDTTEHAFLYHDGAMQDIGSLGGTANGIRGLNNLGMVVGYSSYAGDVPGFSFSRATLYRDGVLRDLNTLVDTDNGLWTLTDAVAINDTQQILVNACTELGGCRTALLTPVPEPAALVLLLAGLLAIGAGRLAAPRTLLFK